MGSIVTFYSYKGGVGRSMVLANVAVLLARRGKRVMVIDWDLEAPGLERYFHYFDISQYGSGLLPMLMNALRDVPRTANDYTSSIDVDGLHPITFMSSGRDSDPDVYSSLLEQFDWTQFFASGGGDYLENLRSKWKRDFDLVLIDSRTGLSDAGGVCTIQLPDVVVAMFTANSQSLLGARDVMRYARSARQALAYPRMELTVFPLLARFSSRTEVQTAKEWLDRTALEFIEFYGDWLPVWAQPRELIERVNIPQIDYFSFGENLAVIEQGTSDPGGLGAACERVADVLVDDFRAVHEVLQLRERIQGRPSSLRTDQLDTTYLFDVYVSYRRGPTLLEPWIAGVLERLNLYLPDEVGAPVSIFYDRTEVTVGSKWPQAVRDALRRSRTMLALLNPEYFRSRWCLSEWETFRAREQLTSQQLIVPIIVSGPAWFPPDAQSVQAQDLSRLVGTTPAFWSTGRADELDQSLRRLASGLGRRLRDVPSYRPDYPIVEPSETSVITEPPRPINL